jgi:nucleoside-diphosphate-sugar epimerase
MPLAMIRGGTGQIGRAIATRLVADGWDVRLLSRHAPKEALPAPHVSVDPGDPHAFTNAVGDGADLLVDCVAFDAPDADRLLAVQGAVGRIIAVSSASVYCDDQGRTLDLAATLGFPDYPVPITEAHPTVAPSPATYSSRKAAMEARLLQGARIPVTILRPCAIHGAHSAHAREWWFVKRLLDGRAQIPLVDGGTSRFQTTAASGIAEAVVLAAAGKTNQIVNVADSDAPSVAEIGQTIMAIMGKTAMLVPLAEDREESDVGVTPWSIPQPLICASSLPPQPTYAQSVAPAIAWLMAATAGKDWRALIPQLAAYPRDHFDYAAEDAMLVVR